MTRTRYPIISEVRCPTHANMALREHLVTHFHNHSVPITWHFSNDPLFTQPPVPGIDFLSTLRRVALLKKSNREILERLSNPRHPTNLLLILDEGCQHFAHQITSGMSDLSAHLYSIQNVESPTALADIHLKQYIISYFIVAFMQKLDSNSLKQSQPFTERFLSSTTRFTSRHSSSWLTSRCNRSARSGTSISKIYFQNTMF